jgi:hypothetical protein
MLIFLCFVHLSYKKAVFPHFCKKTIACKKSHLHNGKSQIFFYSFNTFLNDVQIVAHSRKMGTLKTGRRNFWLEWFDLCFLIFLPT